MQTLHAVHFMATCSLYLPLTRWAKDRATLFYGQLLLHMWVLSCCREEARTGIAQRRIQRTHRSASTITNTLVQVSAMPLKFSIKVILGKYTTALSKHLHRCIKDFNSGHFRRGVLGPVTHRSTYVEASCGPEAGQRSDSCPQRHARHPLVNASSTQAKSHHSQQLVQGRGDNCIAYTLVILKFSFIIQKSTIRMHASVLCHWYVHRLHWDHSL